MYPSGEEGIRVRRITTSSGLAVRVLESGPPSESAVVLLHGWGASVYTFSETIPALAKAGHRVVAVELPGHGLSDKPRERALYTIAALADVVLQALMTCGLRRFSIVAHSMGGALALDIAQREGMGLDRLVLCGAVGVGQVPVVPLVRALLPEFAVDIVPAMLTRSVVRLVLRFAFGTRERPIDRDVDEYWAPTQFDDFVRAARDCIHVIDWERDESDLRSLKLPVLVIAGGRDMIVRGVAEGGKLIPGARVLEIPEAGHLAIQERAEQCNREILAFLGEPAFLATRLD
jgi:pimeloyl-ACP methyl ester carboxylesterase